MKRIKRVLLFLCLALVLAALVLSGLFLFRQKKFNFACNACHEMRVHKNNLKNANHKGVDCVKCHRIASVYHMATVKFFKPGKAFKSVSVKDKRCEACHPRIQEKTVFYHDVRFSHTEHLKAKQHCSKCHKNFVHRKSKSSPLISLRQCRDCHQQKRRKHKPPTNIQDLGELEKQPHDPDWYVDHKTISKKQEKACAECHHQDFCDVCHKNYESHVKNWWANHYDEAMIRLAECQICHRPDYCISCHKEQVPKSHNKQWGKQHWENVSLTECNKCHTLNFCKSCHTREQPSSHSSIKDHAGMKPDMQPTCDVCHQRNSCSSCHHTREQKIACVKCHAPAMDSVKSTEHGNMSHRQHVERGGVSCTACHTESTDPGVFQTKADCMACHHTAQNSACVKCHQSALSGRVKYKGRIFPHKRHTDAAGLACTQCHRTAPSGVVATVADCASCHHGRKQRTACLGCHRDIRKQSINVRGRAFSHDAHVDGYGLECARCHAATGAGSGMKTSADCATCHHQDTQKHCGKCHGTQEQQSSRGAMDFPCDFCHSMDASGQAAPRDNCRKCHAKVYEQQAGAHGKTACIACHAPHSWAYRSDKACGSCHAGAAGAHKVSVAGKACSSCHAPHTWLSAN